MSCDAADLEGTTRGQTIYLGYDHRAVFCVSQYSYQRKCGV